MSHLNRRDNKYLSLRQAISCILYATCFIFLISWMGIHIPILKGQTMPLLSANDYNNFPTIPADFTYAYGDHPDQFGDLYLPDDDSDAPYPVIILIHGGCYYEQYDIKPISSLADTLKEQGFAVWNIEYRRFGNDGDYPTMFLDVAQATDYLSQIEEEHTLNLDTVITVGHSAGGHLALWVAGRHRINDESPLYVEDPLAINGVVALAPIADLTFGFEQGQCGRALTAVMGGDPETVPQHYEDGSPHALLPLGVPQKHIIGTEDTEMLDNTKPYIDSAISLGDEAELIIIPDVGHFEVVDVTAPAWDVVQSAIVDIYQSIPS